MLEKITDREIMTKSKARKKYSKQYFMMVLTSIVDKGDNDLGYVIYAASDERDLTKIPRDEYQGKRIALSQGGEAEPFPSVGNYG